MSVVRQLLVSQLTAIELPPPALIVAAAESECAAAGIRMIPVVPGGAAYPLMGDAPLMRETLRAIADTGVTVSDLEIAILTPITDVARFRPFLEAGGRIGARHVLVTGYDPDERRLTATFAALCDEAAPFGLTADLEFLPWSNVPDLAAAISIVGAAARPNAGVLIDPLHFARSDSRVEDVARVPRDWLHYWQICDAPRERPDTVEGLLHAARAERLYPGEGGLDLVPLLRAMPSDLPISVEIPKAELARTVPGRERVRMAADATRAFLGRMA